MSRRGARKIKISLMAVLLASMADLMPGAALHARWEPEPLTASATDTLTFFDPQPQACAQDAGCLAEMPHNTVPAALATPLRSHLPAVSARILLPPARRWLLASSGAISNPAALVPAPPRLGQQPRGATLPFEMLARSDRLHVAAMFLIGIGLMLGGMALGLIVRQPSEPYIPHAEPWIPGEKVLPRLVASPAAPAHFEFRA